MHLLTSLHILGSCPTWDLRLTNGRTEFEGRVEVCWNREWGTVCNNTWDNEDAKVVCNQLNYTETVSGEQLSNFVEDWFGKDHYLRKCLVISKFIFKTSDHYRFCLAT